MKETLAKSVFLFMKWFNLFIFHIFNLIAYIIFLCVSLVRIFLVVKRNKYVSVSRKDAFDCPKNRYMYFT